MSNRNRGMRSRQAAPEQPKVVEPERSLRYVFPAGVGSLNQAAVQPQRIAYSGAITLPKHGACFIKGFRPWTPGVRDTGSVALLQIERARDRVVVGTIEGMAFRPGFKDGDVVEGVLHALDLPTTPKITATFRVRRVFENDVQMGEHRHMALKVEGIKPMRPASFR